MAATYAEVVLTFPGAVVAGTAINVQTGVYAGGGPADVDGDTVTLPATAVEFDEDAKVEAFMNGNRLHKGTGNDIQWASTTQVTLTNALRAGGKLIIARITII